MANDLDTLVRRFDEDRWLASRFAPAGVRARLSAIYALNLEIARAAETVSQAAIGDIRLAWWREALEAIARGEPAPAHPVLRAFVGAQVERPQPFDVWDRLIAARGKDLETAPFAVWADLEDYIDATAGGVMRAALAASGLDVEAHEPLVRAAAQAWGRVGLLRAEPHWRAKGRALLPHEAASLEEMAAHAHAAISALAPLRTSAPAFPVLGYVALVRGHLRAHERREDFPLVLRQLKLIAAAASGRL